LNITAYCTVPSNHAYNLLLSDMSLLNNVCVAADRI